MDKLDFIKNSAFCSSTDTIKKMKLQAPTGRKYSDKGLVSRIYFLNKGQPIKKKKENPNRLFPKRR